MKIYLVGIGGIGMSALAQLYAARGENVSGSDREASPTTELLEQKGIAVAIGQKAENVPTDAQLVVYSDAVWEDNPERIRATELGARQVSYFEALGEVSQNAYTIAVGGSHGKTTTTAMLAKVLADAGKRPTAIVGSLVKDFKSNFLDGDPGLFVVEACEYKDHILKLHPRILVVTNLEWDHTDYFKTFDALKQTFRAAVERIPEGGALVTDLSSLMGKELASYARCRVVDYSAETAPALSLLGDFNAMNARAAKAAARAFDSTMRESGIDASLASFHGSWRRFEKKGVAKSGAEVYDDYAHHPTEIRATLSAARQKFPGKKILVAFHPHLYTRTRDLMDEFAGAFVGADEVVLAPIYAAREEPIPGITSEALAEKITAHGTPARAYASLEEVASVLRSPLIPYHVPLMILTMGAGDIYKVADGLVS